MSDVLPDVDQKADRRSQASSFFQELQGHEWLSAPNLATHQLKQLKRLATFAAETTEYYRSLDLAAVRGAASLDELLAALPILSRQILADAPASLDASQLPQGQRRTSKRASSGTSGRRVEITSTDVTDKWQRALNLRSQVWAGRNFQKSIAVIRNDRSDPAPFPEGRASPVWGDESVFPFATGPSFYLGTSATLEQQWDWLSRRRPAYLMSYPSIVRAFAARAEKDGPPCPLLGISTVGESVDTELRDQALATLGAEIHDVYSSEEIGVMAIQCPTCRAYHVQDDAVMLEVVDDDGHPVEKGRMGRVLVTSLINYATPLIRYDIGDLAERGPDCPCGRGFSSLARILGRIRNIFRLRDGRTIWPSFGTRGGLFARVRQYQFQQLDLDRVHAVLAMDPPFSPDEEQELKAKIAEKFPYPLQISVTYVDRIAREPGGKFQEFVCLIP